MYYFGARYYDAKLSRWISADPILNSYLPGRKNKDGKLRGRGGVFNTVNMDLYHFSGLNPVRFIDPNGNETTVTISDKHHRVQNGHKVYAAYVYKNTKAGSLKHKIKDWFTRNTHADYSDDSFEVVRDTRGKNLRNDRKSNWKYDTNMEMPPGTHRAIRTDHPKKGKITRIGDVFNPTPLDNKISNPHRPGESRTWFNFDPFSSSGLDGCIGVLGPQNNYFRGSFQKLDDFLTNKIPDLLNPNEPVWVDVQNRHD